jgi:hypothetical protein
VDGLLFPIKVLITISKYTSYYKGLPVKDLADSPLFRFPWEALFLGMIPDKFLDSW